MFSVRAIDVHGHYGQYDRGPQASEKNRFMTATAAEVVQRARLSGIEWTIVSPLKALLPRGGGDTYTGNLEAERVVAETDGLLQYVVLDPRDSRTFEQADRMLRQPTCMGIKIHPEEHCYPITEHGRRIFEFAALQNAVILTHSSEQNSMAADFVPFANQFREVCLILAHIGCGVNGDLTQQVRAIQQCRHNNVFADTSSAMSITPRLIEWAIAEIGADRVLFGTDTPLYFAPMQRARIEFADLTDRQKQFILRDNAVRLFASHSKNIGHCEAENTTPTT